MFQSPSKLHQMHLKDCITECGDLQDRLSPHALDEEILPIGGAGDGSNGLTV
jgi:hypothetical protein